MNIAEELKIVSAIIPVNLATAANNGDYISLKNYGHVDVVVFKGAGTAGEDPVITLKQATTVAGAGAKALKFQTIYTNVGTQTSADTLTKVEGTDIPRSTTDESTYLNTDSAEAEGLFVIPVDASMLDVDGGFDCVAVQIPDVGAAAQIGCALYFLSVPRNSTTVTAITD